MKIDEIKKIIQMLKNSDVKEIEFEDNGTKIKLVREVKKKNEVITIVENEDKIIAHPQKTLKKDSIYIKSSMPGTFYAKPSPKDPPYVKEGDIVNENSVVCIIEAMKIFNEIKAGVSGKIVKILVKDGEGVEYNQNLFELEKI